MQHCIIYSLIFLSILTGFLLGFDKLGQRGQRWTTTRTAHK